MNIDLAPEAIEYGESVRKALEAAGGDQLVQRAEAEPARREDLVGPVLAELGAWELDPSGSDDELEAAAALCRAAGYWAVAYPVAERLSRPRSLEVDGLVAVADRAPWATVGGLPLRWAAVTLGGRRSLVTAGLAAGSARAAAFAAPVDLVALDEDGAADVPLALTLPCWVLLGMLDRALELTRHYVRQREQFGQPLASFQGVQFQLTDAEVERAGLEELAKYALWSIEAGEDSALEDALALRLAAIEAAEVVFRVAHQLHGAIGFCDETTLSWLSRYSGPLRRLPFGLAGTLELLTGRLGARGLPGIFSGR